MLVQIFAPALFRYNNAACQFVAYKVIIFKLQPIKNV